MSDAERSLDINVNTSVDTSGTKEGAKELANVKAHAEGAGHGFAHAETQGRAFHKLLHAISSESPLLGEALRLALNPVTGIIMAGVLALEYYKKKHEEVKKFFEALAKETEATNERVKKSVEAVKDAQIDEGVAALEAQEKLIAAQNSIESASNKAIEAIKLQSESLKALAEIQEKYEMSQATSEEDKKRIQDKYALVNGHIKEEEELKTLVERYAEIEKLKKEGLVLDKGLTDAQKSDNRRGLAEEKEILQGQINKFKIVKEQTKDKGKKGEMDRYIGENEDRINEIDRDAKDAAARVARASKAKADNEALTGKLSGELPGMEKAYQSHAATTALQNSPLSGILLEGADALKALRDHHGKIQEITKGQLEAIKALTMLLRVAELNNVTMVTLIEKSAGNNVKMNARLQAIENKLRTAVTPP